MRRSKTNRTECDYARVGLLSIARRMLWPAAGGTGGVGSQLQIDQLESRTLLTAAVVNTIIDGHFPPGSGTVSLRDAIAAADTSASDTAITFDPTVFSSPQ